MKERTRHFYQEAVRATVERIAGTLDEALDLTELARHAGLSPLHFHRIFRGMLGETPLELHRRLRLERAAFQLATSEQTVTVVAFDAGFETHKSFTRAFQAAYSIAPTRFRKRMELHRERMGSPKALPVGLRARNGIHFGQETGTAELIIASGGTNMDVVVEDVREMKVAAITHLGPRNMVGEAFRRLMAIAGPSGLLSQPGAKVIAVFHDDPDTTPTAELRTSAGVIVPDECVIPAELSELRIQSGKYARATHRGHYARLGNSWDALMGQWLPNSNYRVVDDRLSFELYRVADHSRPDDLETDLYVAID